MATSYHPTQLKHGVGAIGPASVHSKTRTLLVGVGPLLLTVADQLQQDRTKLLVGIAIDEWYPGDSSRPPCLGTTKDIGGLIVEHCIDEIQAAIPEEWQAGLFPPIYELARDLGIPVALRTLQGLKGTYHHHRSNCQPHRYIKRAIDLFVSATVLFLLAPLFAAIAIAVKLTSSGPVFFKQPRVGIRRREFRMWKFRTMVENAEQLRNNLVSLNSARGVSFKIVGDPRLTIIGSFLRRTSLDELPQFLNVLRGDMSLAGPRPIPLWVADQLQDTTYYRRFCVLPGLTGWWQIKGREQDFEVMARQDLYYVDNWSLWLDLRILTRTVPAVIKGCGAH